VPSGLAFRLLRDEEHVDAHGEELDQFTNKEGCMQKYKPRIINSRPTRILACRISSKVSEIASTFGQYVDKSGSTF